MSVLRVTVTVECGVWTLDYESAVSGEPPECNSFLSHSISETQTLLFTKTLQFFLHF